MNSWRRIHRPVIIKEKNDADKLVDMAREFIAYLFGIIEIPRDNILHGERFESVCEGLMEALNII
jgi:hypothetical protein